MRAPALAAAGAVLLLLAPGPLALAPRVAPGLPVVMEVRNALWPEERAFPAFDAGGARIADRPWRVVNGTGNCCENYLATTPEGRVLDFGGSFLTFSDDRGRTWQRVEPLEPLVKGEGAVAVAPNGDVLGVTWDAYSGDHLVAFKWAAASATWSYSEAPVHVPFFDRPWLAVLPGPLDVGMEVPYVALLKGGWPAKDTLLLSLDGLAYAVPSSQQLGLLLETPSSHWLDAPPRDASDWGQPVAHAALMPMPGGALARAVDWWVTQDCPWRELQPDLMWRCFALPAGGLGASVVRLDSLGRVHAVSSGSDGFTWRVSADGGRSWTTTKVPMPADHWARSWDVQVRGALDEGAIGVQAYDSVRGTHVQEAFKLEGLSGTPTVTRTELGDGDLLFGGDVLDIGAPRFDFITVSILPDGKLVTSLGDRAHPRPAVAIEQ